MGPKVDNFRIIYFAKNGEEPFVEVGLSQQNNPFIEKTTLWCVLIA